MKKDRATYFYIKVYTNKNHIQMTDIKRSNDAIGKKITKIAPKSRL